MPNWCRNKLKVEGHEAHLAAFSTAVSSHGKPLDFERILPPPDPGAANGQADHVWRQKNWGSRFNLDGDGHDTRLRSGPRRLEYEFYTAWAPPRPIIAALRSKFPALTIILKYDEPAMGLAGEV